MKAGHSPPREAIEPALAVPFPLPQGSGAARFDPDRELVQGATAGDRSAFEALLLRHYDRMHRVAWRLTGSVADAEDIAQEVCCTLVEKIGTFKGEAKFTTWLMGIVVNACRDLLRRRNTITKAHGDLAVIAGLTSPSDGGDVHLHAWLSSAVARLDPPLRDAVVLIVGEDMTHAEAGAALGVAESTISWRLHQVRRLLAANAEA